MPCEALTPCFQHRLLSLESPLLRLLLQAPSHPARLHDQWTLAFTSNVFNAHTHTLVLMDRVSGAVITFLTCSVNLCCLSREQAAVGRKHPLWKTAELHI